MGTMTTVNFFIAGRYKHVQLDKPEGSDYIVLEPCRQDSNTFWQQDVPKAKKDKFELRRDAPHAGKPVIVFWDINGAKLDLFALALQDFLRKFRPLSLMISGPMEHIWPGVELLGAELLRRTFSLNHAQRNCSSAESDWAEQDTCPVCEGTGMLLQDPCPLCQD